MCNLYSLNRTRDGIARFFRVTALEKLPPRKVRSPKRTLSNQPFQTRPKPTLAVGFVLFCHDCALYRLPLGHFGRSLGSMNSPPKCF